MFYLLGICLALASLLAINALASMTCATLWRFVKRPARGWSAQSRARFLFTLRLLPPVVSFVCVIALLLPAYIIYEPRRSAEHIGVKLALVSLLSVSGLALAAWRTVTSWAATRRLVHDWMKHAEPVALEGLTIPAYRIPHSFPVVAIVGAARPKLFIASQLFETLSAEEMFAAVRHEMGHLAARDNFKRPLLRACRDALALLPCGRALDRAWNEAAEAAADEYTARVEKSPGALALASALIKIARLIPNGTSTSMPAGASLIAEAGDDISRRIRQLVLLAEEAPKGRAAALGFHHIVGSFLCASLTVLVLLAMQTSILGRVHVALEHFVSALR